MDELIMVKEIFFKVTSSKQKELRERQANVPVDNSISNTQDGIPTLTNNTPKYSS